MSNASAPEGNVVPSGDRLRRERLGRRLSLIEVGQLTRIHPRLLEAIETDDVRALPAPVFAIGLITSYARFLDLDPRPFVEAYRARVGTSSTHVLRPASLHAPRRRGRFPSLAFPLLVAGLLLALAGYLYQEYAAYVAGDDLARVRPVVSGVAAFATPRPAPSISPTPRPQAVVPTASTAAVATPIPPAPTPVPTGTAPAVVPALPTEVPTATPVRGVHVDAQVSGRVWLQVEADGRVVFVGILNSGDQRSWSAEQKLMIWSGNGGNVSVTYNGKPLGPLGRPGEVLKVTWTATT